MVMEQKHKDRLIAEFTREIKHSVIYVLNIPDEYRYMDPELVEHFEETIPLLLNLSS